jgi:hypothetical protein
MAAPWERMFARWASVRPNKTNRPSFTALEFNWAYLQLTILERRSAPVKYCRVVTQLILLMLFASAGRLMAQSTIFNIPTTDTVAKKKVYAEFDFLPQVPGTDSSRTYVYNPRLVVGAPGNVEIGVNFPTYNTRSSGNSTTNAYIQPNAKWKFFENEKLGIATAAGAIMNLPLNNRDGQDSWGLLYALFSKKIKTGNYGPRFHAGPFGVVSADQTKASFSGRRAGVILGYEQPVSKRISVVADWFSGKNSIGYFTPGISITLPKSGLLNAGYSIGNDSWENSNASRNRYVFLYYGVTF